MSKYIPFSVQELFSTGSYQIPIYQRNYAWEASEVQQLIQDVADYTKNYPDSDYYIGSLIVMSGNHYETIDGQQRLTTLFILLCAIKNQAKLGYDFSWLSLNRLGFENRSNSINALAMVFSDQTTAEEPFEQHIVSIYKRSLADINSICNQTGIETKVFVDYLLTKVKILRIDVPSGINKNHYFEAMNSRGVQLEQHEIVKASLMNELSGSIDDMHLFERIWEASSNMDRYLQMNFSAEERKVIFGSDWSQYPVEDFDQLSHAIHQTQPDEDRISLMALMNSYEAGDGNKYVLQEITENDETPDDQFYSVINFSNFLLHVLKILRPGSDIALDDKKLNDTFEGMLRTEQDKGTFAKDFAICLLKCRFLYDRFIIKRKHEQWSLKKLVSTTYKNSRKAYYVQTFGGQETNSPKEKVIKLLSMFHVSAPTMIYKNWLHAALKFVYDYPNSGSEEYCDYLERLAKTYMLDRYLVPKEKRIEFSDIIYKHNGNAVHTLDDVDWNLIDQGVAVENFVFNYYDYQLWLSGDKDYDFTYRTSVEHFFPQHPSGREPMDDVHLNKFGNLCLIRSSTNSSFSNHMPAAKRADFASNNSIVEQSLKLQLMFEEVRINEAKGIPSEKAWLEDQIDKYEDLATNTLKKALN